MNVTLVPGVHPIIAIQTDYNNYYHFLNFTLSTTELGHNISMELAIEHIKKLNPANVKTATLIHLTNSKYTPDFYGHEREWSWIIFPWNKREDLVNLIGKILEEEENAVEKIKKALEANFGIDIEIPEVEEVLEHIRYLESVKD